MRPSKAEGLAAGPPPCRRARASPEEPRVGHHAQGHRDDPQGLLLVDPKGHLEDDVLVDEGDDLDGQHGLPELHVRAKARVHHLELERAAMASGCAKAKFSSSHTGSKSSVLVAVFISPSTSLPFFMVTRTNGSLLPTQSTFLKPLHEITFPLTADMPREAWAARSRVRAGKAGRGLEVA
eukprot:CAMPEP_0179061288 /NCGR_PEP_ID=MMETSP0796-20121207/26316_1 /TAXON_ID=73915 /ORGANISM="Pyrodinium bahamense, Strain pbaha01" /LENGTH=179 /DNA_ID=CAMNT_0020758121 /DNA_START=9 /DNA_END=545 /DNA_ORIENTATION=+